MPILIGRAGLSGVHALRSAVMSGVNLRDTGSASLLTGSVTARIGRVRSV